MAPDTADLSVRFSAEVRDYTWSLHKWYERQVSIYKHLLLMENLSQSIVVDSHLVITFNQFLLSRENKKYFQI